MKKEIVVALAALSVMMFAQCAKKMNPSAKEKAKTETAVVAPKPATPEEMAAGKTVFTDNCGKCHKLRQPGEFTTNKWEHILPSMTKKAKLTPAQSASVTAYVMANAKK